MDSGHTLIFDFISELHFSKQVPLEELFQVYENFLLDLGYDGATYTFVSAIQIEAMKELPAVFLSTESYPMGFLSQYTEDRLDQHDFTVRKIKAGEMAPMDWREHELKGWVSKEEAEVIKLARDKYGIKNAISIPMMHEEKGGAGASIISYKEDDAFNVLKEKSLDLLLIITRLFHERIFIQDDLNRKFVSPALESLTAKELVILRYKASGKPMKNIEEHTEISMSYAANVLSDLRVRLGGVNTVRLMYLLGLLNTFDAV